MAKFIYKMENILNIKIKMEEQAKSTFREAMRKQEEAEEKLLELNHRRDGYESILRGEISDTLNVQEIIRCQEAIEILKYESKLQTIVVNSARQQVELARAKLKEAMIEKKTYEKLKELAFEEFKKEINKAERVEIDELVSFTYGKKQGFEE
ncbi:MAG: flagellar protein FliJ [Clostridiales bacterium]|nr:flagellar protein FliJ [Clostridiales bacterium]